MIDKAFHLFGLSFLSLVFLVGCGTAGKKSAPVAADFPEAKWESKLLIRDLKKGKTHQLTVDVLGRRAGEFRLEASGTFGVPVASYVMDDKVFSCAVHTRKVFYTGDLNDESLRPLLSVPVSPVLLKKAVFGDQIQAAGWSCRRHSSGVGQDCESSAQRLALSWTSSADGRRQVLVKAPHFEMDWALSSPSTEVQFKESTFLLKAPPSYRQIQL